MNLGKSVKFCRTSLELSQEELAERVGVSVSYISLIEANKRDPPISLIEKISAATGVPLSLLMLIGADEQELKGVPEELRDKLVALTFKLLDAKQRV